MANTENSDPDEPPQSVPPPPLAATNAPASASNTPPTDAPSAAIPNDAATNDDLPPEARRALAQVQIAMLGQQGSARNKFSARRNRNMIALIFVFMGLFAFGLWGYIYEPTEPEYTPLPVNAKTSMTALPGQFGVHLSPAWTAQSENVFTQPSGARLTVLYGHVKYFSMSPRLPKAFGGTGKPVYSQYTTTAYRMGLPKRVADIAGEVTAWKIKLARHHGLEATARVKNGQLFRSFVLIQTVKNSGYIRQPFRVLELRFRLPGKKGDQNWQEAESIFCSLRPFIPQLSSLPDKNPGKNKGGKKKSRP